MCIRDSSITDATNGVGQLLMTGLYREQWIFWIATNLFSIYLWWGKSIHIQGMYWVYTLNSLVEMCIRDRVNTQSPSRKRSQKVYETPDLAAGSHTLTLVNSKGDAIATEGIYALNNQEKGLFEFAQPTLAAVSYTHLLRIRELSRPMWSNSKKKAHRSSA